jgi:hypothetical protein
MTARPYQLDPPGRGKKKEITKTDTWSTILTAATDFVEANPIIMLVFAAGAVAGILVSLARRLTRAGR